MLRKTIPSIIVSTLVAMVNVTVLQLDHCLMWDTRAQRVLSTVDSGLTNLIHDHCSRSLFTLVFGH